MEPPFEVAQFKSGRGLQGQALYVDGEVIVGDARQPQVGPEVGDRQVRGVKAPVGMRGRLHIVSQRRRAHYYGRNLQVEQRGGLVAVFWAEGVDDGLYVQRRIGCGAAQASVEPDELHVVYGDAVARDKAPQVNAGSEAAHGERRVAGGRLDGDVAQCHAVERRDAQVAHGHPGAEQSRQLGFGHPGQPVLHSGD